MKIKRVVKMRPCCVPEGKMNPSCPMASGASCMVVDIHSYHGLKYKSTFECISLHVHMHMYMTVLMNIYVYIYSSQVAFHSDPRMGYMIVEDTFAFGPLPHTNANSKMPHFLSRIIHVYSNVHAGAKYHIYIYTCLYS